MPEEGSKGEEAGHHPVSRRSFLTNAGLVGVGGAAGYLVGDVAGPSALLGRRGVRGPPYVVFRQADEVRAQNGETGVVEFRGQASDVLEAVARAMEGGGTVVVAGGVYTLARTFPSEAMPNLSMVGEGRSTALSNGGQAFDALDPERVEARDLAFLDRNGVSCYTGLSSGTLLRTAQAVPFDTRAAGILPDTEVKRLGDYVRVRTMATGVYPAISTGTALLNRGDPDRSLRVRAVVRMVPTSESAIPFFAEPFKSDFDNFLGFIWNPPSTLLTLTRSGGNETARSHTLSAALMEGDHLYEIEYRLNVVSFYLDGELLAQHTSNISPPPHEWSGAEPNGTSMACYLKHPYFEIATI